MRRLAAVLGLVVALGAGALGAACSDDGGDGAGGASDKGSDGKSTVEQGRELTLVQAGKLTVCTSDVPQPPFEYEDAGELKGIDVDLVKAITGRLGLGADFRKTGDVFADLAAGRCDLVASAVAVSDELKAKVDFTPAYFDVRQALLVRKGDEAKYKDWASLKGKPVGFPRTAAALVYATDHGGEVTVRQFASGGEAVGALVGGQVEAVVVDHPAALFSAKEGAGTAVAAVLDSDKEAMEEYALALPKDKPALKRAIESAMAQVRSDDSYRTILTNYLGTTAGQA